MTDTESDKETNKQPANPTGSVYTPPGPFSPYYLHPSDHTGLSICPEILKGENYEKWSVAMQNSLMARSKIGFVDGTIAKPATDDPSFTDWQTVNSMIVGWIIKSIDESIRSSITYSLSAENIFIAGTDTSAATIVWAMTELIRNPYSMKRAQQEVRTLIGSKSESIVKEEDLEKLVYLKAVVKETFRLHPVAPLLLPRETTQKCNIQGYEIEEKTLVYVNAWAIGRDPESWENPEEFSPERFLGNDKEIDFRGQDFELIPFGFGRRICPGIQMGVVIVELALANLICLFDWEVPEGMEKQVKDTSVLPGVTTHKKNPLCLVAKKI